jgi:hypothetical protein
MSLKKVILTSLVLALLGRGSVHAQSPAGPPGDTGGAVVPDVAAGGGGAPPVVGSFHGPAGLSPWLLGPDCPDCCGPLSDRNPMKTELFFRAGWTIPTGDGVLSHSITSGPAFEGGGRALFFNHPGDAAWTVEASLSNYENESGSTPATVLLLNVPFNALTVQNGQASQSLGTVVAGQVTARIRDLDRTYASLGAGREWYLFGGAAGTRDTPHPASWRVGFDGGGRWGTAKLQIDNINGSNFSTPPAGANAFTPQKNHLTDTLGAVYVAAHTDVDIPCGCCTFQVGFRAEVDYTWSDILQVQNKSDIISTNLMLSVGVRY